MDHLSRIIILIDMDCFYCQVEENLNPDLKDKPIAVIQSNDWKGGGIIAVNYVARDKGVTRHMRGNEAKEKCPDIELIKVPQVRGKSDLTKYREAGKRVADVLLTFTQQLERASVDEAYLDITEIVDKRLSSYCDITAVKLKNTYVVGNTTEDFVATVKCNGEMCENDLRLLVGGMIAEEIREKIFYETQYKCSAGIAHNKILAKLVCGLHKPNKQTILPHQAIQHLFKDLPLRKIKGLGGKFGQTVTEKLKVVNMGDLMHFSQKELNKKFDEKVGTWLYNLARGIDPEPVSVRLLAKSISCCKQFQGRSALTSREDVEHWLHELADELYERLWRDLEENNRKGKQLTVSFSHGTKRDQSHCTRSLPLLSHDVQSIYDSAWKIIEKNCQKADGTFCIKYLGVGVGNFEAVKKENSIKLFFNNMREKKSVWTAENVIDSDYLSVTQTEQKQDNSYVYFEEIYPNSVIDQTFIDVLSNDTPVNTSHNSIDQEVSLSNSNLKNTTESAPLNSFFSKYYGQVSGRNFNTSKCLDNDNSNSERHVSELVIAEQDSFMDNVEKTQTCAVCHKTIPSEDYQVHVDFHFALDLVKNENHLYKTVAKTSLKRTGHSSKQDDKKKTVLSTKSNSIMGYFQKDSKEIDENLSRVCPECNKRVLIEDFDVHVDFHVAKKIRLEQSLGGPAVVKNKGNKSKKPQNGITKFLRRS